MSLSIFQLTSDEHLFLSQHGKSSLSEFSEVLSNQPKADEVLAVAGSNVKQSQKNF